MQINHRIFLATIIMLISGLAFSESNLGSLSEGSGPSGMQILIAAIVGILGNFVHLVKKQLKGESNKIIIEYLTTHTIAFASGLIVAVIVVIGQGMALFDSQQSYIFTAFLTGYTADSIFGKYAS